MIKLLLLLWLFSISIIAQTRNDLLKKYGVPTPVSEIYQVQPNMLLTVTYGREGQICRMNIVPNVTNSEIPEPTSKSLEVVVNELVPGSKRGRNLINGFLSGVEIFGTTQDYENLKIYNAFNQKKERWINVLWKDKSCNNFSEFKLSTENSKLEF